MLRFRAMTCPRLTTIALLLGLLLPGAASARQTPPEQQAPPEQPATPQAEPPAPSPQQPPAQAAGPVLLGDFAVMAATRLKLAPPSGGFTHEGAAWALLHKGIRLRPELESPLVEGDVVATLTALGYRIRTETPSRVMTRDRMDAVVGVFLSAPAS